MFEQFFEKMKLISLNTFRSDKRKLLHQIMWDQTFEISHPWPQINNYKKKKKIGSHQYKIYEFQTWKSAELILFSPIRQ